MCWSNRNPVCLCQLVEFFGCKAGLRHHILLSSGEAVVEHLAVADANHVTKLVPKIIGIETVGGAGLLPIIQSSFASNEMETFPGVDQLPFAHPVDGFAVYQHADAHRDVQPVAAVQQLLPHTASLPAVPRRNVGKFRFALLRLQKTGLGQQIRLSAAAAAEGGSFAGHGVFFAAAGAFIENELLQRKRESHAHNVIKLKFLPNTKKHPPRLI